MMEGADLYDAYKSAQFLLAEQGNTEFNSRISHNSNRRIISVVLKQGLKKHRLVQQNSR